VAKNCISCFFSCFPAFLIYLCAILSRIVGVAISEWFILSRFLMEIRLARGLLILGHLRRRGDGKEKIFGISKFKKGKPYNED
jgi:purine-cytosine permease-like protein